MRLDELFIGVIWVDISLVKPGDSFFHHLINDIFLESGWQSTASLNVTTKRKEFQQVLLWKLGGDQFLQHKHCLDNDCLHERSVQQLVLVLAPGQLPWDYSSLQQTSINADCSICMYNWSWSQGPNRATKSSLFFFGAKVPDSRSSNIFEHTSGFEFKWATVRS